MLEAPTPKFDDQVLEQVLEQDERIWLVQKDERVFAILDCAHFHDMFWVGYRVIDLTRSSDDEDQLYSAAFWHQDPMPRFVHLFTGFISDTAFAGGITPTRPCPMVSMRALYVPAGLHGRRAGWRGWRHLLYPSKP